LIDEFDEWEDEDDRGWDKEYGSNDSFTKAARGTANILTFINKNQSTSIDFEEILDDMENEEQNLFNLNEKINILKIELKE
ncbi:18708_t:CDS:2, partial [Funneliformis geosporum]